MQIQLSTVIASECTIISMCNKQDIYRKRTVITVSVNTTVHCLENKVIDVYS